jgi:hypothetical protein
MEPAAGTAGMRRGARDQFAAMLPVRERASGTGHPVALMTRIISLTDAKAGRGRDGN